MISRPPISDDRFKWVAIGLGITTEELFRRRPSLRAMRNHYAAGHAGEYGPCPLKHPDPDPEPPGPAKRPG